MKEPSGTPEASLPPAVNAPPALSSGFTPVNSGGFTSINSQPSFAAVNHTPTPPVKREHEAMNGMMQGSAESPVPFSKLKPDSRDGLSIPPVTNGHGSSGLKRTMSHESLNGYGEDSGTPASEGDSANGRRSKRAKKDIPNVAGSHMSLMRPASTTPRMHKSANPNRKPGERCEVCGKSEDRQSILACDSCENGYHKYCLDPPVDSVPEWDWHCPRCLVGTGEFGFEEGGIYSLKQFQEKARAFKEEYFQSKTPFDPITGKGRPVTEDDIEREFWRLVESLTETVEVEYGADIHSTTHGSGFPTIENNPLDPYASDPWNLNVLPLHQDSLFRHIKSDISGMTVPWLYVGMVFSTFCWHNEDHYTYSANYQHFGATKTWYGIPGEDAERFEQAMRDAVPELFETQPDLLFQLVTLLPPEKLRKAGVNVYALDQRAGQFVVTFPQAYHAGFNHGFNFNEAVNFAPADWEPFGGLGVKRLQEFRRQPCFSHDELLLTAASRDTTIVTAKWLAPALERMRDRELEHRSAFLNAHCNSEPHECSLSDTKAKAEALVCKIAFDINDQDLSEEEYQCAHCKVYSYLSSFICKKAGKVVCLLHAQTFDCCETPLQQRLNGEEHTLRYRMSDDSLRSIVQKVVDRAGMPEAWSDKLEKVIAEDPKPALKTLQSLVTEGERIPYELPELSNLKAFVERCNEWVEEAQNYITRKQQNRRKNEKAWRKGNTAKFAEMEERDRELRKIENIHKLLADAEEISFDCPQIVTLRERADDIASFQRDAQAALWDPSSKTTREFEELIEMAKGFNVDVPEVDGLSKIVKQKKWNDDARLTRQSYRPNLNTCTDLVSRGLEAGVNERNEHLLFFKEQVMQGEIWEAKAKELMSVDAVHYQQLEALSHQAELVPVSSETLAAVEAILFKQREAHKQIMMLYQKSQDPDFNNRPKYKEVRDVMEALAELNSKPAGTIDLEREQKRHEDWMRKGKKLFGKANAPLHILHAHMQYVEQRNAACFNLADRPRSPVEPASREPSPTVAQDDDDPNYTASRDVFCICRQHEAGMMIECENCHEW